MLSPAIGTQQVTSGTLPAVRPFPPRYWWLKRLSLVIVLILLAFALLRYWWGYEADRRLKWQIQQFRQAGQPVELTDFGAKEIPKEENAAHWLTEAYNAIVSTTVSIDDAYGNPFIWRRQLDDVRKLVEANVRTLELVRRARSCSGCSWNLPVGNNQAVSTQVWTVMQTQRQIARLLDVAVVIQQLDGQRGRAVETMRDVLFLSRSVRKQPSQTSQTVANSVERMLCSRVQRMGGELFEVLDDEGPDDSAAFVESIQWLQQELLDEKEWHQEVLRAEYVERAAILDSAAPQRQMHFSGPILEWFLQPMAVLQQARELRTASRTAEASVCAHWNDALQLLPEETSLPSTRWLLGTYQSAQRDRLRMTFSLLTHKRLAATAIGVQRYRAAHHIWPANLELLVPDYLPEISEDPFAVRGQKLSFAVVETQEKVYSVGPNGIDDNGKQAPFGRGSMDYREGDIVLFLDGRFNESDARSRSVPPFSAKADQHGVNKTNREKDPTENREKEKTP